MRLIDADKLVALLNKKYGDDDINESVLYLVGAISGASTVDAVEVVRCKDCQYSRPNKSGIKLHCAWWYRSVYEDDFCSSGKRRNDGT